MKKVEQNGILKIRYLFVLISKYNLIFLFLIMLKILIFEFYVVFINFLLFIKFIYIIIKKLYYRKIEYMNLILRKGGFLK